MELEAEGWTMTTTHRDLSIFTGIQAKFTAEYRLWSKKRLILRDSALDTCLARSDIARKAYSRGLRVSRRRDGLL